MGMLLRAVMFLVAAAALTAGVASAKGPNVATICGASACKVVRGEGTLWSIYGWWNRPFRQRGAPKTAPYYRILLRGADGTVEFVLLYSPARRAIRITGTFVPGQGEIGSYWRNVPRDAAERLRPFMRGLEPFPGSRRWPR
jgi:hypothetical protein